MEEEIENLVYFVRHAERQDDRDISLNIKAKMQLNTLITSEGEKEAEKTGEHINKHLEYLRFNGIELEPQIISSPYLRCVQTALGVMKGLKKSSSLKIDYDLEELQLARYFAEDEFLKKKVEEHIIENKIDIKVEFFKSRRRKLLKEKTVETPSEGYDRVREYMEEVGKLERRRRCYIFVTHAFFQKGIMIFSRRGQLASNLIDYCSINLLTIKNSGELKSILTNSNDHLNN